MRIPPIAALIITAVFSVGSLASAAAPDNAAPLAVDTMPGYYPTQQNSLLGPVPGDHVPGYSRTGWPTGDVNQQYRPDLPTDTAPIISPYLLRNNVTASGNPTIGRREDSLLSPFVPQSAVYYGEDGSATRFDANLGLHLQRDVDVQNSQIKAGPLYIHFTQLDFIALYSDITGPYAKQIPDDGFIAAVGLTFDIDLRVSPRTFFEATGTVYYIPTNNAFGFYAGSGSLTYMRLEHSFELDRWDITLYDYFDMITPLSYLLTYGTRGSVADRSGLYNVGFFSGGFDQAFDGERIYFRNTAGVRASTFLSSDVRFSSSYEHLDIWSYQHLHYERGLEHINGTLTYEPRNAWFIPWLSYDGYIYDNYRAAFHQLFLGASMPFTRSLQAYGRVGWAWYSGDQGHGFDDGNLVWDVGLSHRINAQWNEDLVVGNSYRLSPIAEYSHGQYATYDIAYQSLYHSIYAGGSATWAHIEPMGDYSSIYTIYVGERFSDRTSVRGTMIYAPTDFTSGTRTVWLYRAELDHLLTPTLSMKLMYQLTDYHTTAVNGTYVDNLFFFMLSKRL